MAQNTHEKYTKQKTSSNSTSIKSIRENVYIMVLARYDIFMLALLRHYTNVVVGIDEDSTGNY